MPSEMNAKLAELEALMIDTTSGVWEAEGVAVFIEADPRIIFEAVGYPQQAVLNASAAAALHNAFPDLAAAYRDRLTAAA